MQTKEIVKGKDINRLELTKYVLDKLDDPEVFNRFQRGAVDGGFLIEVGPQINDESPMPILNVDVSPTPERENGRTSTTFLSGVAEFGVLKPNHMVQAQPIVHHMISKTDIHRQLKDNTMTSMESLTLQNSYSIYKGLNIYFSIDGSIIYLRKKFPQMVNNDDYDFSIEEAKNMVETLMEIKPLGFVKHSESNFSYRFIQDLIPNVHEYLHEKDLNNKLMSRGQVLFQSVNKDSYQIKADTPEEYYKIYEDLISLIQEYRVMTFKPQNGSEVVRIEFHKSKLDEIYRILKSVDFDKKGFIEPYCQFKSDYFAKHYAKVYEQIWSIVNDPYLRSNGKSIYPVSSRTEKFKKQIGGI